jgi:hypothetical protein
MTGVVSLLIILLIGRSIVYAADNTPRAAVTANYQVAAPTANDALQAALTHIAHERNAPATLRIYQSAFIYLNSPKGAHLVEWEAIVFGLSKKVTLKQSQAYQLIGLPLDAQGKWKVMETAESSTADLLRSMKVPGNADPLSALMRIPELPSNAYRLLFNAQDDASLCKNEKGFIILLTPQGGKLLNLKQQLVKVLPYAK